MVYAVCSTTTPAFRHALAALSLASPRRSDAAMLPSFVPGSTDAHAF